MDNCLFHSDEETIEDLQLAGLSLIQQKKGFRYGMDSVLLADFADIRAKDVYCDFGTGNGVLPILLTGRGKGHFCYAFEIMESAAELAGRNIKLNHLEESIRVIHCDAADACNYLSPCSIDSIICNPPYSHPGASLVSPNEQKGTARSQHKDTLDRMFASAFRILRGKGKIFMVYPAPMMFELMTRLRQYHLEPKRFRMVYPFIEKPANLVLLEAVKDAKPTLHPMPPLIVYQEDGCLTNELKSVYHIQE